MWGLDMRWARVALYSFLGIFALLAITVVLLLTMDLGLLKGTTENFLSGLLDREFTIDGEFRVNLGRHIHIVAEDVTLAGTDWSSDDSIARIGHLEGTVDAWSLIYGPILIESLRIENARIHLEHDDSGDNNWTIFPPKEPDDAEDPEPKERPKLPVMLVDVSITDFRLTYDNLERPRPFQFSATEVLLTQTQAEDLQLNLSGDINETPVELAVTAGTVDNLVDFYDVDFDVSGHLGEIRFDGEAAFGNLIRPRRPTARLNLQGPNAEYLTGILRLQQITTGPLDLTATIAPTGDKMQLLLHGVFGEFELDVSGQFVNLQELRDVDLRVAASGPDARTLASLFGNDTVPEDPFSIVGTFQRSGRMITIEEIKVSVGKTRFEIGGHFDNFPDPHGATATIRIDGPDFGRFNKLLGLPGRLGGPFKLDADLTPLEGGGATVDLRANAQDVNFSVVGNITDAADFLGTRVEVTYAGPNLQIVATAAGLADAPAEPFDMSLLVERVTKGIEVESGSAAIGDDRFTFHGLVGNEPLEADTDIQFEMSGPDLAGTLEAFGRDADELPYAQYKASGRIERGTEYFILHDVAAAIGNNLDYEVTVDGRLSTQPDLKGSRVRVGVSGTSLGAWMDVAGIEGIPDLPFEVAATIERVANGFSIRDHEARLGDDRISVQGLIGDEPLDRDTDIRFNVHAPDLTATLQNFGIELEALPSGEFVAAGRIRRRADHFAVQDLTASLAGANVNVGGRIGTLPTLDGTRLTVEVNGTDFSRLLPQEQKFSALNKPYGLSVKLALSDQELSLDDVEAFLEEMRLTAELEFGLSPLLGSGSFSIDAISPDLFTLAPRLSEISVPERAPMELHTDGDWADGLWTLDNFFLQLGKGHMTASGKFDGPPDFDRTDLSFDWNISSVRNFSVLAGRELPDDMAQLKFRLTGTRDSMTLDEFEGIIGDSDFSGEFFMRSGEVPEFRVGFTSDRIDLSGYLPEPPEEVQHEAESTTAAPKKDRLIPETVIPMDELKKYRASVDIRIAEMNARQRTLVDIVLVGAIDNGALIVEDFHFANTRGGVLAGEFEIRPAETGAELLLGIQASGLTLGLPTRTEEELLALPKFDLDTVLHGSGATVRELAGSLDGYVRLVGGEGKLRTTALRFFTSDFLYEVLNTVNPFSKTDPYSNMECSAILLRFEDGAISGKPAVVSQSDRIRIFANAKIDLKTEKLSVDINTVPRKGLGLSLTDLVNPFTKLGGTLAKPTLTIDPEGALIEGGVAVATVGLSILAKRFKDRFLSAKDPCGKAVSEADPDFQALKAYYYPEDAVAQ